MQKNLGFAAPPAATIMGERKQLSRKTVAIVIVLFLVVAIWAEVAPRNYENEYGPLTRAGLSEYVTESQLLPCDTLREQGLPAAQDQLDRFYGAEVDDLRAQLGATNAAWQDGRQGDARSAMQRADWSYAALTAIAAGSRAECDMAPSLLKSLEGQVTQYRLDSLWNTELMPFVDENFDPEAAPVSNGIANGWCSYLDTTGMLSDNASSCTP